MTTPTLNPPGSDAGSGRPEQMGTATVPVPAPPAAPGPHRRWRLALTAGLVLVLALTGWLLWQNWVPSAPGAPTAGTVTATSVELRWTPSGQGPTVDTYLVQRDGVQVGTVAGSLTTYVDRGLAPDSSHRYAVMAASGSKRSSWSGESVLRTRPAAPTQLKAVTRTTSTVTLRWSPPSAKRAPDGYVLVRDGKDVAKTPASTRSYRDTGLGPATTYTYTVVTVIHGVRSGPSAAVKVATLAPPVSSARLSGSWFIDGRIVAASASSTLGALPALGQTFSSTWSFSPQGASPPGPVVVSGTFAGHPFSISLTPSGATYSGSTSAHLSHCTPPTGEVSVTDTARLSLTVRTAGPVGKTWSARSWTGTLTVLSPYTAVAGTRWYCPSGSMTAALTGLSATP